MTSTINIVIDKPPTATSAPPGALHWSRPYTQWLERRPWIHWVFVYLLGTLFLLTYRIKALDALHTLFGPSKPSKTETSSDVAGIFLGLLADWLWLSYLTVLLWICDAIASRYRGQKLCGFTDLIVQKPTIGCVVLLIVRFLWYLAMTLVFLLPSAADSLLLRTRAMRFSYEFVHMLIKDQSAAGAVHLNPKEVVEIRETVTVTVVLSVFAALLGALWLDMAAWTPLQSILRLTTRLCGLEDHEITQRVADQTNKLHKTGPTKSMVHCIGMLVMALWLCLVFPAIVLAMAHSSSVPTAQTGLSSGMNELFHAVFSLEFVPPEPEDEDDLSGGKKKPGHGGTTGGSPPTSSSGSAPSDEWGELYIHSPTENYTLFGPNTLYRTTHGFKGPKAFNVSVDPANPPNVLVLVVESFRYHDSRYLAGNASAHHYFPASANPNLTITPQFDKWAKRGIGFRNLWSSWRTSRSIESILFGQIPFDSVIFSGTSGGKLSTKLAGMPQLFKKKGYETIFTTGCRTDYDEWNRFLPAHGFDQVLEMQQFKKMAEQELGISPGDWSTSTQARAMGYWGVHDDIALELLGNMMKRKSEEQKTTKKPFFITHYTISSHTSFTDRPKWYTDYPDLPDFSPLYPPDKPYRKEIQQYTEMRYFQDMALGKLLDRMEADGTLNNTIVVVTGDHGQGPEYGLDTPELRTMSVSRVATMLLAHGRLNPEAVGMIFDDAAQQYDLLNTLADIVGVPESGFEQTGVGRSLLRKIPFGERAVWSNNPARKMAVIRGHQRLQYDKAIDSMNLFDIDTDPEQQNDLLPTLSAAEQDEWQTLRDAGRRLNRYFRQRWDRACLLSVDC